MTPVAVRAQLTDALRLDLVGPGEVLGAEGQTLGDASEILPQRPSTWYLTGFLVPLDADPEQKIDAQSADELDEGSDVQGLEDAVALNLLQPVCAICHRLWGEPADTGRYPAAENYCPLGDYTARTAEAGEPARLCGHVRRGGRVLSTSLRRRRSRPSTPSQPLAAWWSPSPSVRC